MCHPQEQSKHEQSDARSMEYETKEEIIQDRGIVC
jgi:hypothetical protein